MSRVNNHGVIGHHNYPKQRAGIIETQPRKRMIGRASTDSVAYTLSDSGCAEATLYLKEQGSEDKSLCFECPFPECQIDKYRKRGPKPGGYNGS